MCVSRCKREPFFPLDGFVPSFLRRLQDGNGVFCFGHWAQKDSLMTKFFEEKKGRKKEKGEVFGVVGAVKAQCVALGAAKTFSITTSLSLALASGFMGQFLLLCFPNF